MRGKNQGTYTPRRSEVARYFCITRGLPLKSRAQKMLQGRGGGCEGIF